MAQIEKYRTKCEIWHKFGSIMLIGRCIAANAKYHSSDILICAISEFHNGNELLS